MENAAKNNEISLPITHFSYSSLSQLLRNPTIFKMKYILGVYDTKMSVSGMIGKAAHEALKLYYGGNKDVPISTNKIEARSQSLQFGLQYLANHSDDFIDYGKTGSREDMLKGYTQAMNFYFQEEPDYKKILICEEKLEGEIRTLEGDLLPLPATGIPDLVVENEKGEIEIRDKKFVTSFTDFDSEDGGKILQAEFLFHLLISCRGIKAKRMVFEEVKRTQNKDGSPQVREWVVPFDHDPYRIIFYNLYNDAVKFLKNNPVFLPNISDMFDGEHAWTIYSQGLINADMSDVEVMHKVRDVAFTSKKFVSSRLERPENSSLLPEEKIKVRLAEFGIPVEPVETQIGPSMIQYRFKVSAGVRMSTIKKHKEDITSVLEAKGDVRILAPIPGTSLIGVEVESKDKKTLKLSQKHLKQNTLSLPIGQDVHGEDVFVPLNEMPHLLIAGTTGSGKSVFINTAITALTKQMSPDLMHLVLIDPKRVELAGFAKLPHVTDGVIYNPEKAILKLIEVVDEMDARFDLFQKKKSRNIEEYNAKVKGEKLPYIVVVIDEFGDLILNSKIKGKKKERSYSGRAKTWLIAEVDRRGLNKEDEFMMIEATKDALIDILEEDDKDNALKRADADVEILMVRLAQMARAVGIHLILATQRPSTDVITGLIKANLPCKIAFRTASEVNSRIILDEPGAEKLFGSGDMLFLDPKSSSGLKRLQGFIT